MRKLVIVAAAVAAAVAGGLTYRAATSEARWHILSGTAINTNRLCIDGLRYTYASGETPTQPPLTRPVGAPAWLGPIDLVVQYAPSGTTDWVDKPLAGADVFDAEYGRVRNDLGNWYPYSHKGTVSFRRPLTPVSESVQLDTQPNGSSEATEAVEPVADCYLFGPLDFKPGDPANTVDFSRNGKPAAAILSTTTFDATAVAPASVRLGASGTEASPISSSISDVDGDGRNDLVVKVQRTETGLVCGVSSEILASAVDPVSGKRFYEADAIQTINC
jgi:hypothetical protein